jgi:hypothetical protein
VNPSGSADDYEVLLSKRDALLKWLRKEGVNGLLSVGLTRHAGRPALLVLVSSGFTDHVPESFNGTTVVVMETGPAPAA